MRVPFFPMRAMRSQGAPHPHPDLSINHWDPFLFAAFSPYHWCLGNLRASGSLPFCCVLELSLLGPCSQDLPVARQKVTGVSTSSVGFPQVLLGKVGVALSSLLLQTTATGREIF